jgi:hypothetical protein
VSGVEPAPQSVFGRRWQVVVAWALWALVMLGLVVTGWLDQLLRQTARPDLAMLKASDVPYVLAGLSAPTVGAVLVTRRPRHPVGWVLLVLGLTVMAAGVAQGYARYGVLARPGALPAADLVAIHAGVLLLAWFVCIGFVLLLTPSGSLPSPRWRWWARIAVAAPVLFAVSQVFGTAPFDPQYPSVVNPLAVPALAGLLRVTTVGSSVVAALAMLVAVGSLVVRFRHARGAERQQLRWVMLAAAAAGVVGVVALAGVLTDRAGVVIIANGVYVALLPVAIGAAILRYRLYDLDRIISRTIAYGLLTVLLGAGYVVVVLGLGQVLGWEQGDSSLVVAGATLAVAAAFQPARRRIQDLVDRRFNRRRYDAERTIAAFSGRLRQQTDLDALTAELLSVVDQTMQPTQAALWLRPAADSGRGGTRVRG